jgi:hypothetical protein
MSMNAFSIKGIHSERERTKVKCQMPDRTPPSASVPNDLPSKPMLSVKRISWLPAAESPAIGYMRVRVILRIQAI